MFLRKFIAGLDGAEVQFEGLLLFGELAAQPVLHHARIDGQQLSRNAHIDHVLHQLAQLGFGTDGSGDLIEGNLVKDNIAAKGIELQILIADRHAPGGQGCDVLSRSVGIQRDQNLRFALAGHIALLAGPYDEPSGLAGDVGGEKILSADGNSHSEDALQQYAIGRLRAGAVHRCHVDAEVVDYTLAYAADALLMTQGKVACRHVAEFPSDRGKCRSISCSDVIIVTSEGFCIKSNPR